MSMKGNSMSMSIAKTIAQNRLNLFLQVAERKAQKMRIEVFQGDITQEETEVIVNAANCSLLGGGGVDGAVHRAAGPGLLKECRGLKKGVTGGAYLTKGHNLKTPYIIHTVGPVWQGGEAKEDFLLRKCYEHCMWMAVTNGFRSISFPAISTGIYGFPLERATRIALDAVLQFFRREILVRFICFSQGDTELYRRLLAGDDEDLPG